MELFDKMVRGWRDIWGVGEFPFYYCQIAPFNYGGGLNSGFIREAQAKGMQTTPNTGMAVLMDSESPDCIHPPKKKLAGERLAFWALAKTYGMEKMHYKSPDVKSVTMDGRVAIITLDMPSNPGLTTHGKEILQFQIAGENIMFLHAKAAISGNRFCVLAQRRKTRCCTLLFQRYSGNGNIHGRRKPPTFIISYRRLEVIVDDSSKRHL